jgi:hypothetical protein
MGRIAVSSGFLIDGGDGGNVETGKVSFYIQ